MKALSIMQPWAWLIVNGHKSIENRSWRCHYRGPILIHAGKKVDTWARADLWHKRHPVTCAPFSPDLPETFERGGIVGMAEIVDCVERSDDPWFVGRFGIVMRNAKPLPFRSCKGALGFFTPTFEEA